ncbi:putative myosin heavy chain [Toxoplasma gondii VAND]|uniref:Putative myosin heavy chain n=1 Tax=Toxoplasma gondii VAND TaxID=933077 RepID=A0A086PN36_TOXGO|nr:putative myosin heavy chain [Toxoplasma gondii VAND]
MQLRFQLQLGSQKCISEQVGSALRPSFYRDLHITDEAYERLKQKREDKISLHEYVQMKAYEQTAEYKACIERLNKEMDSINRQVCGGHAAQNDKTTRRSTPTENVRRCGSSNSRILLRALKRTINWRRGSFTRGYRGFKESCDDCMYGARASQREGETVVSARLIPRQLEVSFDLPSSPLPSKRVVTASLDPRQSLLSDALFLRTDPTASHRNSPSSTMRRRGTSFWKKKFQLSSRRRRSRQSS